MKIVLGSKSPRRKEILSLMGYNYEVRVSNEEEKYIGNTPIEKVASIAKQKADNLKVSSDELLICADTIVVLDGKILGKPKDKDDARQMIKALQNHQHIVYTAVVVRLNGKDYDFVDEATVNIKPMTDQEIEEYINTDEPYDKAGAYAIQGIFSKYILSFSGDYYTIMGLPKNKLTELFNKLGI